MMVMIIIVLPLSCLFLESLLLEDDVDCVEALIRLVIGVAMGYSQTEANISDVLSTEGSPQN